MNRRGLCVSRRRRVIPRGARGAGGVTGFTLIELLAYMGIWMLVVGFGFTLFYRAMTSSKRQARSGDAMVQALQAGERWRADVRRTTGPVGWVPADDGNGWMLHLPSGDGGVEYLSTSTNVLRRTGGTGPWLEVVSHVRNSEMLHDGRGQTGSWRWELELEVRDNPVRVRPLFTFQAVPGGGEKP